MAIAKRQQIASKPDAIVQRDHNIVPHQPIAVDTRYEPKYALLAHVQGHKWIVTYYRQLLNMDTAPEAFNIDRQAPYQQYIKIENFELRVSSPLSHNPSTDLQTTTVSGSAFIHPSVIPSIGDTFVADIGDGRTAYFNIREVTQKSYMKDSVYEIEYDLTDYYTEEVDIALKRLTVKDAVYERAYADYGANPVLDIPVHNLYMKLKEWQVQIANHYFSSFFNTEYSTFTLPVPDIALYDPYIIEFIRRIWNDDIVPDLKHLRVYGADNAYNIHTKTIWDTLLTLDPYSLYTVKNKFFIIPRLLFQTATATMGGIAYSRLDAVYHPADYVDGRKKEIILPNRGTLNVSEIFSKFTQPRELQLSITKLPGLGFVHPSLIVEPDTPDALKYGSFDTYVFSPAFYENDRKEMSKIERMVRDVLEDKPIDAKELLPILKDCVNWGDLERFYYIPVLTALSKIAMGDLR